MNYFSTRDDEHRVGFCEAVRNGLAPDGGLYFPEVIPRHPAEFIEELGGLSLADIGSIILYPFVEDEISRQAFDTAMHKALNFPVPVVEINRDIRVLELFHGPTLAFKDVGARCMGQLLPHCIDTTEMITVLVATSGDTGSAVAHGFHNVDGVRVIVLYPKGKVSAFQEQQMAALGGNIHAVAVDGTFDDCQTLVKWAFREKELRDKFQLTSANSINIARWLPQCLYYFLLASEREPVIAVPSGNFGNFTAGLVAMHLGLPLKQIIAACNANDVVPLYLKSGEFTPRPSIRTVANAMDVGNPSNFERLLTLLPDPQQMHDLISGISVSDSEIIRAIHTCYDATGYLLDPHGATGYLALTERGGGGTFLATAHPAKFSEVYDPLGITVELPERASEQLSGPLVITDMGATPDALRTLLFAL